MSDDLAEKGVCVNKIDWDLLLRVAPPVAKRSGSNGGNPRRWCAKHQAVVRECTPSN